MDISISIRVGTDIKSLTMDAAGVQLLWPGESAEVVMREVGYIFFKEKVGDLVLSKNSSKKILRHFIDQHITEAN